jgi:hypothetical protein
MFTTEVKKQSRVANLGWGILFTLSALLAIYGVGWFFSGPDMFLTNIAERTSLAPNEFMQGNPSAFDVMTLIAQQFAIDRAALGFLLMIIAWEGYRRGSRRAWMAMWVLVATIAATAISFIIAGGINGAAIAYLGLAAVALVGQLLSRKGLSS